MDGMRQDSLVSQAGAVDQGDFAGFFEREYPKLVRLMYLITGSATEAEDMSQEAMARAFERWQRVRRMGAPIPYVQRIALNLNRSRVRRLIRRPERRLGPPAPVDDEASVLARTLIRQALSLLSREQRETLVLVEWLGLSVEEAASVLDLRPSSVRSRIHRARTRIRDSIGAEEGEEDANED